MKRLCDILLLITLSILFVLEPVVFANEEIKGNIVIDKEDVEKYWLNFKNLYKSILIESQEKGIGIQNKNGLLSIDKLIGSAKNVEVSHDSINYLMQFINNAKKAINQYPPIDVSQIDVASENLPGLFINQILGLIAPFFTTSGGGLSLMAVAILAFLAIPSLPVLIVLALGVGIVGLILGIVVGLPVALVFLVVIFFSGLADNSAAQETASFTFDYKAIDSLSKIDSINNYKFYPEHKEVNQLLSVGNITAFIEAINKLIGDLGGAFGDIIGALTDNFTLIVGVINNVLSTGLSTLSVTLPVFALFAIGGFAIFALIGAGLGLILMAPLILPLLPIVLLFVALGLAISGVGFLMFNMSMTPMSIDSGGVTFYDVVNKSVASIKGDASKHLDIITRNIIAFAKETFGNDSYRYFDELEERILTSDLKTEDGIKEATFKILEFIPQIR
jgi:hypothetical protein